MRKFENALISISEKRRYNKHKTIWKNNDHNKNSKLVKRKLSEAYKIPNEINDRVLLLGTPKWTCSIGTEVNLL